GVFIGVSNLEYREHQFRDPLRIDAYAGTGNSASIVANRISYCFDLRGPSLSIDTACSSSLSAIHLACQSLHNGEAQTALVGSVNLMLGPEYTIVFSQAGLLSPDGKCRTFDAGANGYVRGEGVAAIILKPQAQALADGDRICGLIRGSAVNQDGRTLALTAPNRAAQEAMLTSAYAAAGVSPAEIDYVEAHGTATAVGDVVEVAALSAVLRRDRPFERKCLTGSVKTNIGHLECVAGLAGLIKTVLALRHRQIPPSLNFTRANPRIVFEQTPVQVAATLTRWPATGHAPLAGVSAFGFGGTNVHVVLEAAPAVERRTAPAAYRVLPVSARTASGLTKARTIVTSVLQASNKQEFHDLAYTLAKKESYQHRLVVISDNPEHAASEFANDQSVEVLQGEAPKTARRSLGFIFSGVGDHYPGMGSGLYWSEPVY